jgi:hypothetical protein
MEGGERSLKDHFHDAKAKQNELDSLDPRTSVYQDTMHAILSNLQRCQELIQQLAIFSINEEVEDISTQDLQYVSSWPRQKTASLTLPLDILRLMLCWQRSRSSLMEHRD